MYKFVCVCFQNNSHTVTPTCLQSNTQNITDTHTSEDCNMLYLLQGNFKLFNIYIPLGTQQMYINKQYICEMVAVNLILTLIFGTTPLLYNLHNVCIFINHTLYYSLVKSSYT